MRTCPFLSLVLFLSLQLSSLGPTQTVLIQKLPKSYLIGGSSLRFTKPNSDVVPKRTKRSPAILPTSQPPGTPLPGGKPKPDGPRKTTPLRWQHFPFAVCFFFFFNMCVVCFSLCQKSTSLSFCLLFVLLPVQWKCIGFSVSDYTSSHTQFITPCPKEQM